MAEIVFGDRIGRTGSLKVGSAAVIFSDDRSKVLLTRRTDNGRWCLPGGAVDPGESTAEACVREVMEETGLQVRPVRLIGVYSSPHRVTRYRDGNTHQFIVTCYETEIVGGELGLSDETTETGWFTRGEAQSMDIMENHGERIEHAFSDSVASFWE